MTPAEQRLAYEALANWSVPKPADLRLIRRGTSTVVESVEAQIVVRLHLGQRAAPIIANLALVQDLAAAGAPALPPLAPAFVSDAGTATLWPRLISFDGWANFEVGETLRLLHQVPAAPDLRPFDPRARIAQRFSAMVDAGAPHVVVRFLNAKALAALTGLPPILDGEPSVLHGDAHRGNLLRDERRALWVDLDGICAGPKQLDLIPSLVSFQRFHRDRGEWERAVTGYGEDVTGWEHAASATLIRETTMCARLGGMWATKAAARTELRHRIRTWDDPDAEPWRAL